jgi:hypothetical protein
MHRLSQAQIAKLIEIATDFHWMARRYCDGRMTYSTSLFNEHTRALLAMGIELNATQDETVWASDGMGRLYDGLSDSEAAQGRPAAGDESTKEPPC